MIIGGLQKFSALDYPGHLSAIVFTQGCNFRCHFCYNPMLVCPNKVGKVKNISSSKILGEKIEKDSFPVTEDVFFDFLEKRSGKLEAVVITGGEPTLQSDLLEFIGKIRSLGYKIKLDTNGTNPEMLKKLLRKKMLDYIAMDIKGPFPKYEMITNVEADLEKVKKSVNIIKGSEIPHEFRTTVVPEMIEMDDIEKIGKIVEGADKWFLQKFKSDIEIINNNIKNNKAHTDKDLEKMQEIGKKFVKECGLR